MSDKNEELSISVSIGSASFTGDGAAGHVMAGLEKFITLLGDHGVTASPGAEGASPAGASGESPSGAGGGAGPETPAVEGGGKVPFGIFMKRKFPNQGAIGTAIFTWAKRWDGKASLKPGEMETYWKKVLKKPGNPTQVCLNAVKEGWMESTGGGAYAVTGHGESMVDKLPAAEGE